MAIRQIVFGKVGSLKIDSTRIEQPSFKKERNKTYSFSCSVTDNTDLRSLFQCGDGVDVMYRVCGTTERRYPRFPLKMKKALNKLTQGGCKKTRLMNKLSGFS